MQSVGKSLELPRHDVPAYWRLLQALADASPAPASSKAYR